MSERPTAIIAGAGIAGLAAAVLLDELGYQITLIEKKSLAGGRAYSFTDRTTSCELDNGQHLLAGAYHETIALLRRIGSSSRIKEILPARVPLENHSKTFSVFALTKARAPFGLLLGAIKFNALSFSEKLALGRVGLSLTNLTQKKLTALSKISVSDWLKKLGQSENACKTFWEPLTFATLNDSPDIAAAHNLAIVLKKMFLSKNPHDSSLLVPRVSLTKLFAEPALTYLQMRGHDVRLGIGLKDIRVLENRVQNFTTYKDEILKADLYISALPFARLEKTLPQNFSILFPTLAGIPKLKSSPILSINLIYDRPVMKEAFLGSGFSPLHWLFCREVAAENQGAGKHLIGIISGAYDWLDLSRDEILQRLLPEVERFCPETRSAKLVQALVNKEREATLSCQPGTEELRPEQKITDNFFVIGDWTKTGLPATIESAVVSAKRMATFLE